MKFFTLRKDGGPESTVWGYFLIEIKPLFSIVLLRFEDGSRAAYHTHAFGAVSWLLKGHLTEREVISFDPNVYRINTYRPSLKPIWTPRNCFHQVVSYGRSWVLSFRGPWSKTWKEYLPYERRVITLTHGRKVVDEER